MRRSIPWVAPVHSTAAGKTGAAALFGGAVLVLALGAPAFAQYSSSTASSFSRGYNQTAGEMTSGIDVNSRDANGNRVIVDGVTQTGNDNSVFARRTGGAFDQFSGVGAQGSYAGQAAAIGNNLVVVTQGSYNTVIVNAQQTNTGTVTATTTVLNGKINLGGN